MTEQEQTQTQLNRRQLLGSIAAASAAGSIATLAPDVSASGSSERTYHAPALAQTQTISFSTSGNETEFAMFDRIIDQFEEAQSDIKVDRRYDPTLSWPRVINLLRTGTAADVQRLNDDSVWMMGAVGAVTILDDYFDRDLERDDYYDLMYQERVGPGYTLASAHVTSAPLVAFFNLDLFEEAGITPPTDWENDNMDMAGWEEMLSQLLQTNNGRVEVYPFFAPYWQIETALYNEGVDFFSEDETHTTLNTPTAVDVLTRWQSWFEKDYFMPEGEDEEQLFNSGNLAIMCAYADFAYRINENIRFDIGPTWSGGPRTRAFHAGRNFSIPSESQNVDAAWELAKWLLTDGQNEMAAIDWGVPMRKEVAEGPIFLDPEKPTGNHELLQRSMEVGSIPWPNNPVSEAFQVPFRRLSAVDTGQQSPEDFLAEADSYLTGILEAAGWNKSMNTPDYRMDDSTFDQAQPPED